ncbi:hypothetical protein [Paenibacillus sp. EPM92]|uniref:hypothetical protein n=1 Tax=Paenibacillus sp. EPM92 TaxID=1561195 RepID=UPI001F15ED25|nr:hypothetical protein [Paenibacillus sp. EPM92]
MIVSGAFYTAERIAAKVAAYLPTIGRSRGYDVSPVYPQLTDNLFVWLFGLIGFVLLVFGFPKRNS